MATHQVWNDQTQAVDFDGTEQQCREYAANNGGGELSVRVAPQASGGAWGGAPASASQQLEAAKRQLSAHEATLAEVKAGRVPAHLRSPGAQRDFVMRIELCRKNVRVLAAKVRKSREQTPDEKLFEAIFGRR